MVIPVSDVGPHHRVVVLMVFAFVVGVGYVERVGLSVLKRPRSVGIVMVVICTTPNSVWASVQDCELIEVSVAVAIAWC